MTPDSDDYFGLRSKLNNWFQGALSDASNVELFDIRSPHAGVSNETFFASVRWTVAGAPHEEVFVIRWPPTGFRVFPDEAYDMWRQSTLISKLGAAGIDVAPVRWFEPDVSVIGTPFYVMTRVKGWVPGDFPPYHIEGRLFEATQAEKQKTWWTAVDQIASIHCLDWEVAGLEFLGVPESGNIWIEQQVSYYERVFAKNAEPLPEILMETRGWLLENFPGAQRLALCWGDARLGNMVVNDFEVTTVLDWEMACIGDPESDLGWFSHMDWATSVGRSNNPFPRMEGLPTIKETIQYYERKTGLKVLNLRYYEIFAAWRMAILFTRIEQDERYLASSGNKKGLITWTHFERLKALLNAHCLERGSLCLLWHEISRD